MLKLTKCCCCIPVKTGTYIIGYLHIVTFIAGVVLINPFQISLDFLCWLIFLVMVIRDSQQKRLFYFAAYCVYVALLSMSRLFFIVWDYNERPLVVEKCQQISNYVMEKWDQTDYKDVSDCRLQLGRMVLRDELLIECILIIVQVHFAQVLFTHYKNASVIRAKGGCQEEPEIQICTIESTDAT